MIYILDITSSVDGTVGSKNQKIGTSCTEEESKDKKPLCINNSGFFCPYKFLYSGACSNGP